MPPKSRARKTVERETDAEKKLREAASSTNLEYLEAKLAEIHAELEKERVQGQDELGLNLKPLTSSFLEEEGWDTRRSPDRDQVSDQNNSASGNEVFSDEEPVVEDPPSPRDRFSERDAVSGSEDPPHGTELKDQLEPDAFSDQDLRVEDPPSPRESISERDAASGSEGPHSPSPRAGAEDEEDEDPETRFSGQNDPSLQQNVGDVANVSYDLFETSERSNESPARENRDGKSPEGQGSRDEQSAGRDHDFVSKADYQKLKEKLDKRIKELKKLKVKYQQLEEANDELKDTCSYQATEIMRLQQNEPAVKAFSTVDGINLTSDEIEDISRKSKNAGVFAQKLAIAVLGADALRSMSVTGNGYLKSGEKIKKPPIPEDVLNFIYGKVLEKNLIEKGSKGKFAVLAASNPAAINRALAEKIQNLHKAYLVQQSRNANAQAPLQLPAAKLTEKRIEAHSSRDSAKGRKNQPVTPLHAELESSKRSKSKSQPKQHEKSNSSSLPHPSSNTDKRSRPPISVDLGKSLQLEQVHYKRRTKDHSLPRNDHKLAQPNVDSGIGHQKKAHSNKQTPPEEVPKSSRPKLAPENRLHIPRTTNHQSKEQKAHGGTATTVRPSMNSEQRSRQARKSQTQMSRPPSQTARPPAQPNRPESTHKHPPSGQEQKLRRSEPNADKRLRMSQLERPASSNGLKVHHSQQLPPPKKQKNHHYSQL